MAGACAVTWSPDGRRLTSRSFDYTVRVWDAVSGADQRTLPGHTREVTVVAWSPDGRHLASASRDGTVRVWDATGEAEAQMLPLRGALDALAFHPFQARLAVGNEVGEVWLGNRLPESYGPLVLTTIDRGNGLELRCPGCQQNWPVVADRLGRVGVP
jgi:WD40 repeat protein